MLSTKAAVALMRASVPSRSARAAAAATAVAEWEKGSMVYRDPMEERDAAYLKASSANGLMPDSHQGTLLTEQADYLTEARVDYMYKGPCDVTSSLQLNSATQFMLENSGYGQPINAHCATLGANVPAPANLAGSGLSHLHFKGSSAGLGHKFIASNLLGVHPARQVHTSAAARQQGVQDAELFHEYEQSTPLNAQGIQGDADSAQGRLWVTRCLGDGLYTDCVVPPEARGRQRKTVQQLFVQQMVDIRAAAEGSGSK